MPTNSNRYLNGEINSTANVVLNEVRPVAHLASYEIFEHIDILGKIVWKKHIDSTFCRLERFFSILCESIIFWKNLFYIHFPFYYLVVPAPLFRLFVMQILFKPYSAYVVILKCFSVPFDIPAGPISCVENLLIPISIYMYIHFCQSRV